MLRLYGDVKESISVINLTLAVPDQIRTDELYVEISERQVMIKEKAAEETLVTFNLNSDIILQPETCTVSDFVASDGAVFRLQTSRSLSSLFRNPFSESPELKTLLSDERGWLKQGVKCVSCLRCGMNITRTREFSRVLELPSENWFEVFEPAMWCHKDCVPESVPRLKVAPRNGDCLVSTFYYLLHFAHINVEGIQIEPHVKAEPVNDSCRLVQTGEVLCKRCQSLIGYIFWDIDQSGCDEDGDDVKPVERKEYTKIYKHAVSVTSPDEEEHENIPALLDGMLHGEKLEFAFAALLKQHAEESTYRFLLISDDPSHNSMTLGLVRLMATDGKIMLSREVKLDHACDRRENLNCYQVIKVMMMEQRDTAQYDDTVRQWQDDFAVSHLVLPCRILYSVLEMLLRNTACIPPSGRRAAQGSGFRLSFLRYKPAETR